MIFSRFLFLVRMTTLLIYNTGIFFTLTIEEDKTVKIFNISVSFKNIKKVDPIMKRSLDFPSFFDALYFHLLIIENRR